MPPIFKNNKLAFISVVVIVVLILTALLAPLISPYNPDAVDLDQAGLSPGQGHFFGTDEKGRDIFSRVIYGARVSLSIGSLATVMALLIGTMAGLAGGYFGGKIDTGIQMITDITLAFPGLLLAIGITVVLSPGFLTVLIALSLVGWASMARLVRGEVISLKEREYVEAGRAGGLSHVKILFYHILPNCVPIILVAASLKIGAFILAEAALSFLDLGVRPPTATWGFMISAGREYLKTAPWMTLFPGAALALAVISFNILGDAARDHLDPKLKS
ncbi:MAG: ABC transporter permease [Candidatus Auribacterota bacterium]|nr:ABC transporter permease [Candidatus Auribacterota bacterium]